MTVAGMTIIVVVVVGSINDDDDRTASDHEGDGGDRSLNIIDV